MEDNAARRVDDGHPASGSVQEKPQEPVAEKPASEKQVDGQGSAFCTWFEQALLAERDSVVRLLELKHQALLAECHHQLHQSIITPRPGATVAPLQSSTTLTGSSLAGAEALPSARRSRTISLNNRNSESTITEDHLNSADEQEHQDAAEEGRSLSERIDAQLAVEKLKKEEEEQTKAQNLSWRQHVERFVQSPGFELAFGALIILNTLIMAVQRQYEGLGTAHIIEYKGALHQDEVWPSAYAFVEGCEWLFGCLFTAELLLKIIAMGPAFVKETWWNWFDSAIVLFWLIERCSLAALAINPMLLRLARIMRLMRLLRIVRWVQIFDPLHLMLKSISSSVSTLCWSLVLLVLIIMVIAICTSQALSGWIESSDVDYAIRVQVFESWGTFTRAMVSLFEITLANWGPPCRLLMNNVSEWWALFFLVYKFSIGFAVVQVILSVFIQQTFKVAARDEEVMIKEKAAAAQAYLHNLERLFEVLDESGDGQISEEEFTRVLGDPRVKTWFAALEVDVTEVHGLFSLLDDGDGNIEQDEFIRGVKGLKGFAKGTDMMALMRRTERVQKYCAAIEEKVDHLEAKTQRLAKGLKSNVSNPLLSFPSEALPDTHLASWV